MTNSYRKVSTFLFWLYFLRYFQCFTRKSGIGNAILVQNVKNRFFELHFLLPKNGKWLLSILVIRYSPCKLSKPKNASKKLKNRHEKFLMIKKLLRTDKKPKNVDFLKNLKCKHTFLLVSSERSRENFSCNVLLVGSKTIYRLLRSLMCWSNLSWKRLHFQQCGEALVVLCCHLPCKNNAIV